MDLLFRHGVKSCLTLSNNNNTCHYYSSNGEVEVLEDIPEVAKAYKVGADIQFTATFNAGFDPELQAAAAPVPADETVIDAEVEEVE